VLREAIGSRALILEEMATRQQAMCRAVEPGLTRSAGKLRSTAAELSDLLVRGPGSASTGAWMHDLEEVNQRKVRAERDFAEESHELRGMGERSEPSLEEIAAALPARSALVSIFHFGRHLSPEEPTKVDSYAASVLRSGDPQPSAVSSRTARAWSEAPGCWPWVERPSATWRQPRRRSPGRGFPPWRVPFDPSPSRICRARRTRPATSPASGRREPRRTGRPSCS